MCVKLMTVATDDAHKQGEESLVRVACIIGAT